MHRRRARERRECEGVSGARAVCGGERLAKGQGPGSDSGLVPAGQATSASAAQDALLFTAPPHIVSPSNILFPPPHPVTLSNAPRPRPAAFAPSCASTHLLKGTNEGINQCSPRPLVGSNGRAWPAARFTPSLGGRTFDSYRLGLDLMIDADKVPCTFLYSQGLQVEGRDWVAPRGGFAGCQGARPAG